MKKEDLIALGLDEATADKITAAAAEEMKGFIPKARFDEINGSLKDVKDQLAERDTQLVALGDKAKGNDELTKQIADLQAANEKAVGDYSTKIQSLQKSSAIKEKLIGSKAKHSDLLMGKFDMEKITIKEDGSIEGLDEQLTAIQESYKDLFDQPLAGDKPENKGGPGKPVKDPDEMTMDEYSAWYADRNKK